MMCPSSNAFKFKLSAPLALALSVFMMSASPRQARALPFVDLGAKLATGSGVLGPDGSTLTLMGGGAAARLDLPFITLELNTLYLDSQMEVGEGALASKSSFGMLAVPAILRVSLLPLPIVDISVGAGFERRFYLGDYADFDPVDLIPVSVCGDFSLPALGTVGVEARFNYSLADVDEPTHEVMLLAHVLF